MRDVARRILVPLAGVLVLGGCGRAAMSVDDATQVAVDAFADAGLDAEIGEIVEGATVDRAIDGEFIQVHQVELIVDGRSYLAGVDRRQGAVVRLNEPNDTALTDEQVEAIAGYRDNPAEEDARRTRTVVWAALVLFAVAAAMLFFRRERRKAELAAEAGHDEISLA